MTLILTDYTALLNKLRAHRVVVIEGARCTGKDYLIGRICADDPARQVYEALKPRKKFMVDNGSLTLPARLDIQQSHLWSLDVFRQLPDLSVLVNRSMLTSMYFDGPDDERFTLWRNMLEALDALVVLLSPPARVHAQRIAKAGRAAEAVSIEAETQGIRRHAAALGDRLVVFS